MTEFRVLGPLEVRENGHPLELGGGKQRALLAVLLLGGGETVSTDRLIDALWGETPPARAPSSLHSYVSRLRRTLGSDRLVRTTHGYQLVLEPGELDLDRFERLLADGRRLRERGDASEAAKTLEEALDLWHGAPLADFTYEPFAASEIARLEELQLEAIEERIEADLSLGRYQELVPELETLVREHPLRERLLGQLMIALYRSGRQAEALEAYRRARSTFAEELGLEPSPALQQLEREILTHDRTLQPRAPRTAIRRRRPALLLVGGALVLALVVAGAIAYVITRDNPAAPVTTGPNAVAIIDPESNRVVDSVPVGTHPVGIAYRGADVWVANVEDGTVSWIDPDERVVKGNISIGAPPVDVVLTDSGAIWTGNGSEGTLSNVSPTLRAVAHTTDLSGRGLVRTAVHALAYGAGSLWAATSAREVVRVDARTGAILHHIPVETTPYAVAFGDGAAWVITADNHLQRIEPRTNTVTNQQLVGFTAGNSLAVGAGGVWAGAHPDLSSSGVVSLVDPGTVQVESSVRVEDPWAIAVEQEAVWVASYLDKKVYRVDPASARIVATIPLRGAPAGIAVVDDEVWVTIEEPEF
jgi:YVTN family beta-propeller protein